MISMQLLMAFPFVGRKEEIERILRFYNRGINADRTAVVRIIGEAGIGKSALLHNSLSHIAGGDTVILRLKFYPDSSGAVSDLLAQAITTQPYLDRLLTAPVEHTIVSVIAAVRRIARLRATVLAIEDIHLIGEGEARELSRLLHAIQEEPICILCSSRPQESAADGALAPFLVDSIVLKPLNAAEIRELLERCGVPNPGNETVELLRTITEGYPFLLRAVLPELAFRFSSSFAFSSGQGDAFARQLRDRTRKLAETLTADLTPPLDDRENETAEGLALLGEVFSEEGANAIFADAPERLQRLREKGILIESIDSARPLFGTTSVANRWAFTHTILHQTFLKRSRMDKERLLDLMEAGFPLYSITPLLQLAAASFPAHEIGLVERVILLLGRGATASGTTAEWSLTSRLFTAAEHLYRNHEGEFDGRVQKQLRLMLLQQQVQLLEAHIFSGDHERAIGAYLEQTANPDTLESARFRLEAFRLYMPPTRAMIPTSVEERLDEWEELLRRFPELAATHRYIIVPIALAGQLRSNPRHDLVRRLDAICAGLRMRTDDVQYEEHNHFASMTGILVFSLLSLFKTRSELERRDRMAEEYLQQPIGQQHARLIPSAYAFFLIDSGRIRRAQDFLFAVQASPDVSFENLSEVRIHKVFIEGAFGAPTEHLEEEFNRLALDAHRHYRNQGLPFEQSTAAIRIAFCALSIGLVRDDMEWGIGFSDRICGPNSRLEEMVRITALLAPQVERLGELLAMGMVPEDLVSLARLAVGDDLPTMEAIRSAAAEVFLIPVIHRNQLLNLRCAVALTEHLMLRANLAQTPEITTLVADALRSGLDWCREHELAGFIPPVLRLAERYLPTAEYAGRKREQERLLEQLKKEFRWGTDINPAADLRHLTMIGEITITGPNGEPQRIQGGRGKQILGAMTANMLMRNRLSFEDFREVAVSPNISPADSGNTLRVAISRLRTVLGKEGIIADGITPPRLNTDLVRIDLIEIAQLLERAALAVREGRPRKAKTYTQQALNRIDGEPIYPTLYGEFFDAARRDFELHLRAVVIDVTRLLCREGDAEEGADLLKMAAQQMPGDEEISEELLRLLELSGRNAEAVSLRRRFAGEWSV